MKQIYLLLSFIKSHLQLIYILNLIFSCYLAPTLLMAQTSSPVVKVWDKTLGGKGLEQLNATIKTPDGGYLIGGCSKSTAEENWDYRVMKLNAEGEKVWDKTFGGEGDDVLKSLIATSDGGYLLGGYSSSGIGGDKTENSKGGDDFWIVKIGFDGGKEWDRTFGGEGGDVLNSLIATSDGGYLLGGYSWSGVGGDKTEDSRGFTDFWVVKLNSDGSKAWDRTLGGNNIDTLWALIMTPDGGYLLGGQSGSDSGGDITDEPKGFYDFWIVKLNANGTKLWDKTYGGIEGDILTTITTTIDGGVVLGGYSSSGAEGDKSENSRGGSDYWIIKIDVDGSKMWDKTLGGNTRDELHALISTSDGGYLLGGYSSSLAQGDKTEDSREGYDYISYDYWVVKLDSNGVKSWDKTFGGLGNDMLSSLVLIQENEYILCGSSASEVGVDKSQSSIDTDYWLIKVFELPAPKITTQPNAITIKGGESTSFSIEASGQDLTYQWQVSKDGGTTFSNISNGLVYSGATTAALAINNAPISMNGNLYRVQVRNGAISTSNAVSLTVNVPAFDNNRVWQVAGNANFSDGQTSYSSLAIGPNDTPLLAYMDFDNDYKATVKKLVNSGWDVVGYDGFTPAQAQYTSLAVDSDNVPYLAFQDADNEHKITVMKFNGIEWEVVGKSAVSSNYGSNAIIVIDKNDVPFVAYDEFGATVKRFNGSDWQLVGSPKFSGRSAEGLSMALDVNGIPYIAFSDKSNSKKATVMKFNGEDWGVIGKAGFTQDTIETTSLVLDANGTPYIAFTDQNRDNNATVMRFDGSVWEPVGKEGFSLQMAGRPNIKLDTTGTPYVSYSNLGVYGANLGSNASVTVMRFNGASWEVVGKEGFSGPRVDYPSLALDSKGILYVSTGGWGENDIATVMKFAPASTSPSTLSGTINSPKGTILNNVVVKLSGAIDKQTFTTSSTGAFSFNSTEAGTYTLAPTRRSEVDATNGITTLDIVQIQRHILGVQSLATPYRVIAADVNSSGSVSTLDIALIRSLILHNATSFPGNRFWAFVSSDFSFSDPANPFPFDSTRTYSKVSELSGQDFIGIKLGDVNDSWDASTARIASAGNLYFNLQDKQVKPGAEVVVPVTVSDFKNVSGYQFTLNWDPKVLEFSRVEHGSIEGSFGIHSIGQGKLTTMWAEPSGGSLSLADGAEAFKVRFKVVGGSGSESMVEIGSSLTKSVAYTGNLAQLNVQSQKAIVAVKERGHALYQNMPNPFSTNGTSIRFSILKQEEVNINIYNSLGHLLKTFKGTYEAGEHELTWDGKDGKGQPLSRGTYFYRMEAGKFSEAKRAIIL